MTTEQHHADATWAIDYTTKHPNLADMVFAQLGKPALTEVCRRLTHDRSDRIADLEQRIVAHFKGTQ